MTWTHLRRWPKAKHILIVDDYADALDIWAIYLTLLGYRVSTAADGAAAIAQAEQLLPDLIVLDLELPGVSGFEVAQRLRGNPATHDIPLIAATGYSHERQLDGARRGLRPRHGEALRSRRAGPRDRASSWSDPELPVSQPIHTGVEQAHKNG